MQEPSFAALTEALRRATPGRSIESAVTGLALDAGAGAATAFEEKSDPPPLPTLDLLKDALRTAVRLEFATIPPYLTALWSIIDQGHPVARSLRAIVHEEMLHLSLLCNLLAALGEEPRLTGEVAPIYPGKLPGDVHPELTLELRGYGPRALAAFMELERPETPIPIEDEPPETFPPEDVTIGEFYVAFLAAFEALDPPLASDRQIAGPFTWFVMTELGHVRDAIGLIMAQGEGAVGVPYNRYPKYLSHYYRFKSMTMERELVWHRHTGTLHKGDVQPAPSVYTLASPPRDGYGPAAPVNVLSASRKFEETYSAMLRLLENSWQDSGDKSFIRAIECMFELATQARIMMQTPTPDGRGHCPSFRYRP